MRRRRAVLSVRSSTTPQSPVKQPGRPPRDGTQGPSHSQRCRCRCGRNLELRKLEPLIGHRLHAQDNQHEAVGLGLIGRAFRHLRGYRFVLGRFQHEQQIFACFVADNAVTRWRADRWPWPDASRPAPPHRIPGRARARSRVLGTVRQRGSDSTPPVRPRRKPSLAIVHR